MTVTDPTFLALQSALAGRFSLESEIGRGGMGVVYLARDVILERPVAIKLLAPALAAREEMRRRFLREARIAAQCFHPNIVPIHEVAEQGDLAWFVMGYVAGETLAERLRRAGPLPAEMIRRIGREIGWALSYAHERGVVHRDVKPENILLEQGTDRALIADFGIAVGDRGPLASGEVAGTARFMAPEQAMGEALDGRADLYALGVTLYLAATGHYPFEGHNALAIVAQQQASAAPPVRAVATALPDSLADAIDRCLATQAADRFENAHAFVAAIERSPAGDELPRDAREVRTGALATMNLVDWTIAIGLAGVFLVLGEEPRSLGRAITVSLAQGAVVFAAAAATLRAGETLFALRRAIARGTSRTTLVDALAPGPTPAERPVGLMAGVVMLGAAFSLALAQAQVDALGLPSAIELAGNVATWLVPPMLVQRALAGMRRTSGLSGWLYSVVRRPLAQRVVRLFGRGRPAEATRPVPTTVATELFLGQAAEEIFARLPDAVRQHLQALPAATRRLADDAVALRARALSLSGEQRRMRMAATQADAATQMAAAKHLERERDAVQARLGATIAAIEAIRIDLLRLEHAQTLPGHLTEDLDVVRDLQRRIDAEAEVRALLREARETPSRADRLDPLAPEPTPV